MMDIKNVHNIRAPLRNLDHDYGGPSLRKFRDRDVRVGSEARSGRARADRFAGIGRAFKSLLARVADHFSLAPSRSVRGFNRAHEAYSREADKLLDELATDGDKIDPGKLVDRLRRLRIRANEMAKHIAMKGPDGQHITRESAKAMGKRPLALLSDSQQRALRKELLAARVGVALDKAVDKGAHEYEELKNAFNGIDWQKVERGLETERENYLSLLEKERELYGAVLAWNPPEPSTHSAAVSRPTLNDLRTIRDLVVTSEVPDDVYRSIGDKADGILGALDDETDSDDDFSDWRGFGAKLTALGRMEGIPHQLERVFRDRVANWSRDDAERLHQRLKGQMVNDSGSSVGRLRHAAWFPNSGKDTLKALAERVHNQNFQHDDEGVDEVLDELRQGLKSLLTLGEVLEERSVPTEERFRDQAVGRHRDVARDLDTESDSN